MSAPHTRQPENLSVIAVTNRSPSVRPYEEQIARICRFHPAAVIVREKDLPEEEYARLAEKVLAICRQYSVRCIYHTYPEASRAAGVKEIHLPLPVLRQYAGEADLQPADPRRPDVPGGAGTPLSFFTAVGTSVHSMAEAEEALRLGATYLTAGHIYSTDCKKGVPPRGLSFLEKICRMSPVPVYAIGGIHLGTGQLTEVLSCGAAGGCIMSEMMRI